MEAESYNPLEMERLAFQPGVPQLLKQISSLEISLGEQKGVAPEIAELFPNTSKAFVLHFKEGIEKENNPLKVGAVLSGGQAPGGHNVICGLFEALKQFHPNSVLIGFLNGPSGILEKSYLELNEKILAPFRNTGGFDLIGSGRTKIETPKQLEISLKNCESLKLDGLVIVGGDDSNTNAAILAEYFLKNGSRTRVVGVPKTIDGDLKNHYIETSFGFDTACKTYCEIIGNICRDAKSAKKYTHFIRLMGRSASHITLECALQTHPNIALIGEELAEKKTTLKDLVQSIARVVIKRAEAGKNYGVILIPEGLIEFFPEMKQLIKELNIHLVKDVQNIETKLSKTAKKTFDFLPKEIAEQLLIDRDPHGNVQVSHIATEQLLIHLVEEELKNLSFQGTFSPLGHFFGYEGRAGFPSNFDANYTFSLGLTAALLIQSGYTGYMSAVRKLIEPVEKWIPAGIPITSMMSIEERKGKEKPVIAKALVDLKGEPFKTFSAYRQSWELEDHYRYPGPIQFFGPKVLTDVTTFTLKFEQKIKETVS